jgi:vacuolar-type H+-ATPase subunit F/Vma7
MTHTLRVVCRPVVCDGFALAGVPSLPAVDGTEAAALLGRLVEQAELGVVLVEEVLYRALPRELHDALERRALPVVVPFPGPRTGASVARCRWWCRSPDRAPARDPPPRPSW